MIKVGDWVETCRMLPGIVQKIDGDDIEIFFPDMCAENPEYMGYSLHSIKKNCGVHTITPEYAIALMSIGEKELKKMWDEMADGDDWENLVWNKYKNLKNYVKN